MGSEAELVRTLEIADALRTGSDFHEVRRVPGRSAEYAPAGLPPGFTPFLVEVLTSLGITRLWRHQWEAMEVLATGEDVVIESPTASGKTLCFALPVIDTILKDRSARALFVYPMKALSNDQRRQLLEITRAVNERLAKGRSVEHWIYDGDTPAEEKRAMRESPPHILITTPEMLHLSFMQYRHLWRDFLKNLRYLVVDEIHEYRGFFGTNMALLLRRLLAHVAELGARPQVVACTATCGNPKEHAERLTGRSLRHIRGDTAWRPDRTFIWVQPAIPDHLFSRVYLLRVVRAALALAVEGRTVIAFGPTRRFVEEAAKSARSQASGLGLPPESVVPYKAGYKPDDARAIQEGLRDGKYRVVFSTNALELGIDIGHMDVCLLAGFPDSPFSAWQRIGRAGRRPGRDAVAVFYAMNNPFDEFIARNLTAFLERGMEEIYLGYDNEELIARHAPLAATEVDDGRLLAGSDQDVLGTLLAEEVRELRVQGEVETRLRPNYVQVNLRAQGGTTYKLVAKGKEVGTISDEQRFREAYDGAVYVHLGVAYRVRGLLGGEVHLEECDGHLRTEATFWTVVSSPELIEGVRYDQGVTVGYGNVTVFENFGGYKLIDTQRDEVLEEKKSQDAHRRKVRAMWIEVGGAFDGMEFELNEALLGVQEVLRVGAPFVVPCDRHDFDVGKSVRDPMSAAYLYESIEGGIGVAERAMRRWRDILERGLAIVTGCTCREGCPRCILRKSTGGTSVTKGTAIRAARALLEAGQAATATFDRALHVWRPISPGPAAATEPAGTG